MEKISTEKLPPIFKMSVLCNILPYYGHIHRWRRLLEKINTETNDIWDQNREQLMYIGRDFKREIKLDKLKENARHLRPNRSWIDLFSLSLSNYFDSYFSNTNFDITNLTDNLTEDEVIIIDSHDDVFNLFKILYCSKDRISNILPAIKCPSFKSETKFFTISEIDKMKKFMDYQNHTKSIMIENAGDKLSINLVYGNTIKITPNTFLSFLYVNYFEKLQERYKLCEIDDCVCKPKKIRVEVDDLKKLKHRIEELERISSINDVKLGMNIVFENYKRSFSKYDTMVFNHSARRMSDETSKFIFTGDTLAVVSQGNYYNFRLDEITKKSEDSYIQGRI